MKLTGKIHKMLPQEEIVMKDGSMRVKNGFVVMGDGEFPKPVAFEMWGEEKGAMLSSLNIGDEVEVSFYITSSETQKGMYRTSLRCVAVGPRIYTHMPNTSQPETASPRAMPWSMPSYTSTDDGLPFDNEEPPF